MRTHQFLGDSRKPGRTGGAAFPHRPLCSILSTTEGLLYCDNDDPLSKGKTLKQC
jgi:hypothetical protein